MTLLQKLQVRSVTPHGGLGYRWHQVVHFLMHTVFPHSANPIANFLWTTLTLLTVVATIGMLTKLLRREKGLAP